MRQSEAPVDAFQHDEDVQAVVRYLASHYRKGNLYRLIFLTGCNTGLLPSQLLSLTIGDYTRGYVEIGKKIKRRAVFNVAVLSAFDQFKKSCGALYWNESAVVAESQNGSRLGCKYMHWLIADACRALGIIGNWGSQSMRKTFALALYRATKSAKAVKSVMRLHSLAGTRSYLGLADDVAMTESNASFADVSDCELCEMVKFTEDTVPKPIRASMPTDRDECALLLEFRDGAGRRFAIKLPNPRPPEEIIPMAEHVMWDIVHSPMIYIGEWKHGGQENPESRLAVPFRISYITKDTSPLYQPSLLEKRMMRKDGCYNLPYHNN